MTTRFEPTDANVMPRFSDIATFMRLPHCKTFQDLQIGLIGVPWDGGTTNRPGTRYGPREIRSQSVLVRQFHPVHRFSPFERANVADLGDVSINPVDLPDTLERISRFYRQVAAAGVRPLTVGGDHLTTLPILRALAADGPLALVHFDAHSDTWDTYYGGSRFTHGTPFRRAVEECLIDPRRTVQIGLRGSQFGADDHRYAREAGMTLLPMDTCEALGMSGIVAKIREVVGAAQVYVSFDIDCLDPAFAPGTGTPEIGGLTTRQAQQLINGLLGLPVIGADVVEVSPPFDVAGITALAGATLMFELLCVMVRAIA